MRRMVPIMIVGMSLAVAGTAGFASKAGAQNNAVANTKHESPFACDRMALDAQARRRHFEELGPALRPLRQAVRELPDGYEFQFPSDAKTVAMVFEWAAGERLCCPFFDIQVRMEREGGPLWLRLTGREGTKEFIKVDGAKWIQPVS